MTRKIEQQIESAIAARRSFCGGNTQVTPYHDDLYVTLHGHKVAHMSGNTLTLDWCGYNTPTTRSRLNCVLRALAPQYVAAINRGKGQFFALYLGNWESCVDSGTMTIQVQP